MPTGYTSFIEDGKVKTAKQFLHLCLRNFGICIRMRDDDLKLTDDYTKDLIDSFQKDLDYHQRNLDDAKERLKTIQEMSDNELCAKYIKETTEKIKDYQKMYAQDMSNYGDYLRIKEEIENWDCDERFQNIKEFAINQIEISIPSSTDYYKKLMKKCGKPTKEGYEEKKEEYRNSLIADAEWDIKYHTEEIDRILKQKEDCLKFYQQFKEELEKLK